jgi:hypothetical protein
MTFVVIREDVSHYSLNRIWLRAEFIDVIEMITIITA